MGHTDTYTLIVARAVNSLWNVIKTTYIQQTHAVLERSLCRRAVLVWLDLDCESLSNFNPSYPTVVREERVNPVYACVVGS